MTDETETKPESKGAADVQAIQRIIRILDGLDGAERSRVMQFVVERYQRAFEREFVHRSELKKDDT